MAAGTPTVISTEAEWRNLLPLMVRAALGREISRLRVSSKRFPSAPYRHATPLEMTVAASAPLVISTKALRSGEISPSDGTGDIGVGDLSTQSIIGAFSICPPYRRAAPLEMTVAASAIGHTFGVRVDGPLARGLWPPNGGRLCIASLRGRQRLCR